jgi:DNA helicase-2/ATP-dependent DNA helicase PcrA
LQARADRREPRAPASGNNDPIIDATAVASFSAGERVFHQKFGYGTVQAVDGDKLDIAFEKAGGKKVVARFVSRADDLPF